MSSIPAYPDFAPISLEMAREITPHLLQLPDGISEFSFAGLYLFRYKYNYRVALKGSLLIIRGEYQGKNFFITPCCKIDAEVVDELFQNSDYWKLVSPTFLEANAEMLGASHYIVNEDRDNYDYLYLRSELAVLSGKKFHKKKNHVNAFELAYPDHQLKNLDLTTRADALQVLEEWVSHETDPAHTDYSAAVEALELLEHFEMNGQVLYVSGYPVAWCLAEPVAGGRIMAVHFEKARIDYRGAYQFINYAFARSLPESVEYINREQDLGDDGMRQAKMTYRPARFVQKYRVSRPHL